MKHDKWSFGTTNDGQEVTAYRVENENGFSFTALNYGCAIQALCVPTAHGNLVDVVQGYNTLQEYEQNNGFFGMAVGRVCNRIAKGRFCLNDKEFILAQNDRGNHLHGGQKGFNAYVWKAEELPSGVRFSRLSPNGEEGYPGNMTVQISYTLRENTLQMDYAAQSDADTLVNLTNHSYFNLDGTENVLEHSLCINADTFCECNKSCLPTGVLLPVEGTPLDFLAPKVLGKELNSPHQQMQFGGGYDHHFVINGQGMRQAAQLQGAKSGLCLTVFTDAPGMQLYTSNGTAPRLGKRSGQIKRHGGVCLETQIHPDAIHHAHFPSMVLLAGQSFQTQTQLQFSVNE